ncbi:hypothetical protein [Actinoplanes sp. NPDC023714]|uniref:hypothetical protein n=1 Tax=Actinoplanes sp. NPDC023714 TaxID=3154322 RepID=UPI0033D57CEE
MDEKPRFAIRRGAVELSRRQWSLLGGVLVIGITSAILLVATVSPAAGAIALGITAVTAALTIGFGHRPKAHR